MPQDRQKILIDSIRRLQRRNAVSHLRKIVNKTHAADLPFVFPSLTPPNQRELFNMIESNEKKGLVLSELDPSVTESLIDQMDLGEVVQILETMAHDDLADLIGKLPEEKANAILEKMRRKGADEIEGLLRYGDETAGGIMVPDFVALKENMTAREAISSLQKEYADVEMPFYLYVVDEYGRLVGVLSLRQLVVVSPDKPLREFMTTDVLYVRTDTDQEEVARLVARYDILAVPVVNEQNQLMGIVTVDDIIDIIRQEATEDMLKMAGAGQQYVETKSVIRSTRIRLPWLFASCLGGIVAFLIIGQFEGSLKQVAYLAAFIPVIMGMGGNIGTQSSTIVVRGLATGYLQVREIGSVVLKELTIGVLLGLVYGSLLALVAQFRYQLIAVAVAVGSAVLCSMSVAALVGSLVPMLFARLNIDPAVATGPFVTTSIDIISVYFYFAIATTLMGI